MTKTQFFRHLGLGCRLPQPIPAINYEAHRNLGRMAADLNQVVRLICDGKCDGINPEFARQLYEEMQAVRRLLLGVKDHDREDQ